MRIGVAVGLVALVLAMPDGPRADEVPPTGSLALLVEVRDVRIGAAAVRGVLVNRTDGKLEDVRLLVQDTFSWTDELHPGADSPGRATYAVVHGPIPPRGEVAFEIRREALPDRSEGRFETSVTVVGLTRYEPEPVPARPRAATGE
ncbi:MAG: hypothetical protein ACREQL_05725 [Candidatus Binatia bacterium]